MTFSTIILAIAGALLVGAYALWDLGAERLLASFGRFVLRALTFGRVAVASDSSETQAIGIATASLLVIFIVFLIIASRVH
jgi:hypothetical protein